MIRTQSLAMFAVAAFALGGLAFAPAFADYTHDETETAPTGGTDTYTYNEADACGTKTITTKVKISESNPGNEDSIRVDWDGSRCSVFTDATITVWVDGNFHGTHFSTSSSGNVTFGGAISGGDSVRVQVIYDTN